MPNVFLVMSGALVSVLGTIVVLIPILAPRKKEIEKMRVDLMFAALFWQDELFRQRKYAVVGLVLFAVGTALQLTGSI